MTGIEVFTPADARKVATELAAKIGGRVYRGICRRIGKVPFLTFREANANLVSKNDLGFRC